MKKFAIDFLLPILGPSIFGFAAAILILTNSSASSAPEHIVWEYKVESRGFGSQFSETYAEWLNRQGAAGWEFCDYERNEGIIFKRPRRGGR